jgi:hypothetical protein
VANLDVVGALLDKHVAGFVALAGVVSRLLDVGVCHGRVDARATNPS